MTGRRRHAIAITGALAALPAAGAALAATAPKPVVAHDPRGDVRSTLDLTRFSLARAADGRLRAALTLAAAWDAGDLTAKSGPPGSLCVKLWTTSVPPD